MRGKRNEIIQASEVVESSDEIKVISENRRRVNRKLILIILLIAVLGAAIFGLYKGYLYQIDKTRNDTIAYMYENFIIKEKAEVTDVHIRQKLEAIGELATYSFEYTNEKTISDAKSLFGSKVAIPGTKSEISIVYSGVIKVGYEIMDIKCEVDNDRYLIYVTIPEAKVLDNYIKLDDLQCVEKNGIFNHITTAEVLEYFKGIEDEELVIAEEKGIYGFAEEQLEVIVRGLLESFEEYEVLFVK